jgi:hypothetical protein
MSTPTDQKNEYDPQPLRPSENSHHSPSTMKRRVPSSTSKKESGDHDAAARTNPRVSPGTLRGVGKRCTRHPSGRNDDTRKRHRIGVETTGISPDPQKTTPQTIHSAPLFLSPTSARHLGLAIITVASLWPKLRGQQDR